tara:strand:- start:2 stop:256 length:255 start_codon:yes stop_codon:yes gene_type:complete
MGIERIVIATCAELTGPDYLDDWQTDLVVWVDEYGSTLVFETYEIKSGETVREARKPWHSFDLSADKVEALCATLLKYKHGKGA